MLTVITFIVSQDGSKTVIYVKKWLQFQELINIKQEQAFETLKRGWQGARDP